MTQVVDSSGRRVGWRRPVAVPEDVDTSGVAKARGVVELPVRVSWSGPRRTWDLDDPRQRAQVYEMVLTDGTDEDVRRFIDLDVLVSLWPKLHLPRHVCLAWQAFLKRTRQIDVGC